MDIAGKIEIVGRTDTGRVRDHNEDAIADDAHNGFVLLADGMGGYSGGEIASGIAITVIKEQLQQALPKLKKPAEVDEETGLTLESLAMRAAAERANDVVYQTAKSQPQYEGMGTTLVAVTFFDNRISVAHVGDSRLYRVRQGVFEQITRDHSLLQDLIDKGFYTPEEAKSSLNKNVLTRALGNEPQVEVDVQEEIALPGDIYLLCSDGLTDMVEDKEISLTISAASEDLVAAVDKLVELANQHGGRDNISVILVKVLKEFSSRRSWFGRALDWLFE